MLIEEFQLGDLLGTGSYAQVYKAKHIETNKICAIKILSAEPSQEVLDKIMKEMNIMIQCESENIVRCFGSEINDYGICLFLEYCKGSVADLVKTSSHHRLSEYHIASILEPVLRGLDYLHANKKIHRDIKAANILVNEKGEVKLGDFGVSAELIHTYADKDTMIGSPFWMSPEIIGKNKYNFKTDIWSLGITAIELAERVPPYSHLHPVRAMFAIQNNPPKELTNPSLWSPDFNSFVKKCLTVEASLRPTARELLQHPFITGKSKGEEVLLDLLRSCSSTNSIKKQKGQLNRGIENMEENTLMNESGTMIEHSKLSDYQPFWEGEQRIFSENSSEGYNTMVEKEGEEQEQEAFMKFFKKPEQTEEEKYAMAKSQLQSLTNQMNVEISAIKENYKQRIGKYEEMIKKYEMSKVKELESKDRRHSLRKPTMDKGAFKIKKDQGHPNERTVHRVRTQIEDKDTLAFDNMVKREKSGNSNNHSNLNKDQENQYYNMFIKNAKGKDLKQKESRDQREYKEFKETKGKSDLNHSNKTIQKIYSIIKTQQFNKTTKELSFKR